MYSLGNTKGKRVMRNLYISLVPFNTNKHWATDNEMQLISACSCLLGTDAQVFSHEMSKLEPIHPSARKDTSFSLSMVKYLPTVWTVPGIHPIIGEHSTHVLICVSLYLSFLVQGVIGLETNRSRTITVFRIRYILKRIRMRIRILGFIPMTNGSGFGSCTFRQWPSRRQKKFISSLQVFMLIPFWRYIYSILQ